MNMNEHLSQSEKQELTTRQTIQMTAELERLFESWITLSQRQKDTVTQIIDVMNQTNIQIATKRKSKLDKSSTL